MGDESMLEAKARSRYDLSQLA